MRTIELDKIFHIQYGNQFDFDKMKFSSASDINFVSRTSQNLGIIRKVDYFDNQKPFPRGLITVSLGGTYLLSSFVQPEPFYTAQNIKVLTPILPMSEIMKLFYCYCIEKNRYKYISHGREANKTLNTLKVPIREDVEKIIKSTTISNHIICKPVIEQHLILENIDWHNFKLSDIFEITLGNPVHKNQIIKGKIPYITRTAKNNGIEAFCSAQREFINDGNCITIGAEGVVAFYQDQDFVSGNKINIIRSNNLNKYNAIFISTVLNYKNIGIFNYGYALVKKRLQNLYIKLPIDSNSQPNWQFMEDYIKSLPYSANL